MTQRQPNLLWPSLRPLTAKLDPADEEALIRDWTLSEADQQHLAQYRKNFRLPLALQLCAVRLYGRYIADITLLSPQVVDYIAQQLQLTYMSLQESSRKATWIAQQQQLLHYLGFQRLKLVERKTLQDWIHHQLVAGLLPAAIMPLAEQYLFQRKILLPGTTILQRQIANQYQRYQQQLFQTITRQLSNNLKISLDQLLDIPTNEQHSFFARLKEYPAQASTQVMNEYLANYQQLCQIDLTILNLSGLTPKILTHYFEIAKRYHATAVRRFATPKRYSLLICFIIETRKILLDYIVELHDQFITGLVACQTQL